MESGINIGPLLNSSPLEGPTTFNYTLFGPYGEGGILVRKPDRRQKGRENREFSRDHKSSEQFVWLNRRHREMETQLAHSSVAFDDTNSASGGVDLGSFSGYGLPWVV
jgi:hypothetical protein